MKFKIDNICDACQLGKLTKSSFKSKKVISTTQPLELLHMDLFRPTQVQSINHNRYVFVIVDDFSRFMWTIFLKHKSDTFENFKIFVKRIQNIKNFKVKILKVIMEVNLKMKISNIFVTRKELIIISPVTTRFFQPFASTHVGLEFL